MKVEAHTGTIVSCNNQTVTEVSGEIAVSGVSGFSYQGTGVVSGGGGSGSIKSTTHSLEKGFIRYANGRELPFVLRSDSIFRPGHVATMIFKDGQLVGAKNQTLDITRADRPLTGIDKLLEHLAVGVGGIFVGMGGIWLVGMIVLSYFAKASDRPEFITWCYSIAVPALGLAFMALCLGTQEERDKKWWSKVNPLLDSESVKHRELILASQKGAQQA